MHSACARKSRHSAQTRPRVAVRSANEVTTCRRALSYLAAEATNLSPSRASLAPDALHRVDYQFHFRPLLVFSQQIAFRRRRKSTLRTQRQVLQWEKFGRLVDSLDYVLALFKLGQLGADYTEHHNLVL